MAFDPVKPWVDEVAKEYKGQKVTPKLIERIFWTAFRCFLWRESHRHRRDIVNLTFDDGALARKGIPLVPIPNDLWIKVPEK